MRSIYSLYLSGLNNERDTDTSKRNEAHGEGKWNIRASSRYVRIVASWFRTCRRLTNVCKRPQDEPSCAASSKCFALCSTMTRQVLVISFVNDELSVLCCVKKV